MKYTVIIPVYNGDDTIEQCLRSIVDQEHLAVDEDYCVLLIDDGSTDSTVSIARNFPVSIMSLTENQGRIVARLTGARNAKTDRLLFVDSRISLPRDFMSKLDRFDAYPAVIGELHSEETKYKTIFDTVFYLIRRKYYGSDYFPLKDEILLITKQNFRRAPKGTAVLLIDRDLFIRLTPDRTGRDVNDDTLLFHNLVFRENIDLLRARELFFQYSQRTRLPAFCKWLFDRGTRFADFYLSPGGYYFIPFLLSICGAGVLLALLTMLFFTSAQLFFMGILVSFALYLGLVLYLVEASRDFPIVFFTLPPIFCIFIAGIAKYWVRRIQKCSKQKMT